MEYSSLGKQNKAPKHVEQSPSIAPSDTIVLAPLMCNDSNNFGKDTVAPSSELCNDKVMEVETQKYIADEMNTVNIIALGTVLLGSFASSAALAIVSKLENA